MATVNRGTGFVVTIDFDYIPALIAKVEANSRSTPKAVADRVAQAARGIVPVDTGQLRDSIVTQVVKTGKEAEVLVLTDYAAYVEYGTYRMSAQPYLGPAFARYADDLMLELADPLFSGP
jgi:HK97 gp10 family phage protein